MRVLEQILLFWVALSVVASLLIARAWEASEKQLAPVRISRRLRRAPAAEAPHTAV